MSEKKHEKEEGIEKHENEKNELEELVLVREMISDWLGKLGSVAKEIIAAVINSIDGSKFSKEIVDLYNNLKSAGLPENLIVEIVRDFYKKKLEIVPSLDSIMKTISGIMGRAAQHGRREEELMVGKGSGEEGEKREG